MKKVCEQVQGKPSHSLRSNEPYLTCLEPSWLYWKKREQSGTKCHRCDLDCLALKAAATSQARPTQPTRGTHTTHHQPPLSRIRRQQQQTQLQTPLARDNNNHNSLAMTDISTEESTVTMAAHQAESSQDGTIEVLLSRAAYRLGGSVVGTIRLTGKKDVDPRAWFQSARVYVAGRCRVDGRWHNPDTYKRIYGQHPHLKDHTDMETSSDDTVCFWATNVVNLLELKERTVGQWKDANPKAMVLKSGLLRECEAAAYKDHLPEESTRVPLESQHLAFTFRVDLPLDIPHSAVAACVRYSYSAVVSVTTASNEVRRTLHEQSYECLQTTNTFTSCCDCSFSL